MRPLLSPPSGAAVQNIQNRIQMFTTSRRTVAEKPVHEQCGYQSLFPRLYRLLITIILQDHPGFSRQTLRCFLVVDPRACGCAHNPPRCVSTPPSEKENLRRDYCPTIAECSGCRRQIQQGRQLYSPGRLAPHLRKHHRSDQTRATKEVHPFFLEVPQFWVLETSPKTCYLKKKQTATPDENGLMP